MIFDRLLTVAGAGWGAVPTGRFGRRVRSVAATDGLIGHLIGHLDGRRDAGTATNIVSSNRTSRTEIVATRSAGCRNGGVGRCGDQMHESGAPIEHALINTTKLRPKCLLERAFDQRGPPAGCC